MFLTIRLLMKSFRTIEIKTFGLRTTFAIGLVGVAVAATSITLGAVLIPRDKTPASKPNVAPPPIAPALMLPALNQGNSDKNVTILVLQLRNGGFVPGEITRPLGNYELIIINVSLEKEGALRLEREKGERVEIMKLERRNIRKLIRFTPGNYVLRVANQPTWLTRITITER